MIGFVGVLFMHGRALYICWRSVKNVGEMQGIGKPTRTCGFATQYYQYRYNAQRTRSRSNVGKLPRKLCEFIDGDGGEGMTDHECVTVAAYMNSAWMFRRIQGNASWIKTLK
jgi:hypothetical protein